MRGKQILLLRSKKMVLPQVKNSFACRTKILLSQFSHHEDDVDYFSVLLSNGERTIKASGNVEVEEPEKGKVKRKGIGKTRI